MNLPINHKVIEHKGEPVAVIVPYAEYLALTETNNLDYQIPHEVLAARVMGDSSIKAWRKYRGLKQSEAALALKITQSAYSQMEAKPFYKSRESTQIKLMSLLEVTRSQLADFEQII